MSANRNLARLPLAGLAHMVNHAAAGLRGDTPDVLLLSVDSVCRQTFAMLRTASPLLEQSLKTILPFALLAYGLSRYIKKLLKARNLAQKAYGSFLCHITVSGLSPVNKQVRKYMVKHGIGQNSRSMTMSDNTLKDSTSDLTYLPSLSATAWFQFEGVWLKFSRSRSVEQTPETTMRHKSGHVQIVSGGPAEHDLTISCFSLMGSVKPIKKFLEHVKADAEAEKALMTRIVRYVPNPNEKGEICSVGTFRTSRKLDSVSMEATKKTSMIDDMTVYLSSQQWYADRGIPWRRGYMLYGPPGTGKTSLSAAIAGHFALPLYVVSLTSCGMNDSKVQEIFDRLPPKCVVLLEDIDSAGVTRETMADTQTPEVEPEPTPERKPRNARPSRPKAAPVSTGVTLSGLLNAIDGPCSQEGRILICTTNSPDTLDPALIRPGRIDLKILLGYATAEVMETLFLHIFEDTEKKSTDDDLATLAKKFAAAIPEDQISPAELQGFLMLHRTDPVKAVEAATEWAEGLLETRRQGGNVASFNGQI